jgi:hypothetical protein
MKVMETATSAAGEFLEVCAVFVAVVGLWFHWVLGLRGSIELAKTTKSRLSNPIDINQPYLSARIGWLSVDYLLKPYVPLFLIFGCRFGWDKYGLRAANSFG